MPNADYFLLFKTKHEIFSTVVSTEQFQLIDTSPTTGSCKTSLKITIYNSKVNGNWQTHTEQMQLGYQSSMKKVKSHAVWWYTWKQKTSEVWLCE